MKRQTIITALTVFLLFVCININNDSFAESIGEKEVTRGECIMHIMKLLGVDDSSADAYANYDYTVPVFQDLLYADPYGGYIIIAKFNFIANGISHKYDIVNYFESDRNVTVKECMTFILRCFKEPSQVNWDDSILSDSVELGLLTEKELEMISGDEQLTRSMLQIILERMTNISNEGVASFRDIKF